MFAIVLVLLGLLQFTFAAKQNDEMYSNYNGTFYVYTKTAVLSFNPQTPFAPFKTISSTGSTGWGDSVYMKDPAQLRHYVVTNDAGNSPNKVWIFDADQGKVISTIPTSGLRPVHIFGNPLNGEIWSHLDTAGTADVVNIFDTNHFSKSAVKLYDVIVSHV